MIKDSSLCFVLWSIVLILVSFLLRRLWSNIISGRVLHALVFPGIVVHEFSHVVGALISGARVDEISIFSPTGGYVKHGKPAIPIIGELLISFAPVVGGIASLRLLASYFTLPVSSLRELVFTALSYTGDWFFWLFIYLSISIIISITPSKKDLSNSALALLFVATILFTISYFNLFNLSPLFTSLSATLVTGIFFGGIALLASLPIYLIKRLL